MPVIFASLRLCGSFSQRRDERRDDGFEPRRHGAFEERGRALLRILRHDSFGDLFDRRAGTELRQRVFDIGLQQRHGFGLVYIPILRASVSCACSSLFFKPASPLLRFFFGAGLRCT